MYITETGCDNGTWIKLVRVLVHRMDVPSMMLNFQVLLPDNYGLKVTVIHMHKHHILKVWMMRK